MSEDTFVRVLDQHAHDVRPFHLDLSDVRTSAHRIRRRRRVVATSAAALVAAVAVGVPSVLGSSGSRTVPEPAPPVPSVTVVPGTTASFGLDAPAGRPPAVSYLRLADTTAVGPDGSVQLPADTAQAVPYAGGWLALVLTEESLLLRLDATGDVVEDLGPVFGPVQSTPGLDEVAWIQETAGGGAELVVTSGDGAELQRSPLPVKQSIRLVGAVADGWVYVLTDVNSKETAYVVDADGTSTPVEGFIRITDTSPVADVIGGHVRYTGDYQVCSSVLRDGAPLWPEECDTQVRDLSPDGTRVAAGLDEPVPGFRRLAILDTETGEPLVTFDGGRHASVNEMAWEDDDHLLVAVVEGDQQAVLRLGVDGSVERAVDPVPGDPMGVAFLLAGEWFLE